MHYVVRLSDALPKGPDAAASPFLGVRAGAQSARGVSPLAALLLDFDRFKTINDTASIGVAVLPDDAGDAPTLIGSADRALYSAKKRAAIASRRSCLRNSRSFQRQTGDDHSQYVVVQPPGSLLTLEHFLPL
jgi:hypothetical protein